MAYPITNYVDYAKRLYQLAQQFPDVSVFPEALVQRVDDKWLNDLPSTTEALFYRINPFYACHLLARLADGTGDALEVLCEYLMS